MSKRPSEYPKFSPNDLNAYEISAHKNVIFEDEIVQHEVENAIKQLDSELGRLLKIKYPRIHSLEKLIPLEKDVLTGFIVHNLSSKGLKTMANRWHKNGDNISARLNIGRQALASFLESGLTPIELISDDEKIVWTFKRKK